MSERERFEAWAAERGWPLHKIRDSVYADRDTGNVWVGWQAAQSAQEPVAYRLTENRGNGKTEYRYYDAEQAKFAYRDNCLEITPLYISTPVQEPTAEMLPDCMMPDGAEPCAAYKALTTELAAVTAERDAEIGKLVRAKMKSGNAVTVERCTITANEIAAIDAATGSDHVD